MSPAACSCIARATAGSRSGSAHARGGHRSSESHAFLRQGGPGFKARSRRGSSEFLPRRRFRTACAISARSWELRFRRAARSSPRRCGDVDPRRVSKRTQPSTVPRGHVLIATYLSADGELEIPTIVAEPQDLDLRYRAAWMEERSVLDHTLRVVVVLLGRGAPGRVDRTARDEDGHAHGGEGRTRTSDHGISHPRLLGAVNERATRRARWSAAARSVTPRLSASLNAREPSPRPHTLLSGNPLREPSAPGGLIRETVGAGLGKRPEKAFRGVSRRGLGATWERAAWRRGAGTPSHPFHPVSHPPSGDHLGTLDSLHARRSELPVAGRALGVRNPGTRSELRADRVQPSRRGGPGCEPGRSEARDPGRAAWAVRGAPHGADPRVRASERAYPNGSQTADEKPDGMVREGLGRLVPDGAFQDDAGRTDGKPDGTVRPVRHRRGSGRAFQNVSGNIRPCRRVRFLLSTRP